jgi:SAM-dependent methyltransferase
MDINRSRCPLPDLPSATVETNRAGRFMGRWSQIAGQVFLDWLRPASGLRWLDVGCGNGAFTETLVERCAPASIHGVDPSDAQLAFARTRPALRAAEFRVGDAMALPFPDASFDATVMPLVIFFVSQPALGVAEMARVLAPGGIVCANAWDMLGGGFAHALLHEEMRAMGVDVPKPPYPEASKLDVMRNLWEQEGLQACWARPPRARSWRRWAPRRLRRCRRACARAFPAEAPARSRSPRARTRSKVSAAPQKPEPPRPSL